MTIFAFLDVETTGLDPVDNYVLEVAWQFTDSRFNPIGENRSYIVDHGLEEPNVAAQIRGSEFITKMHSESGLLKDLANQDVLKLRMDDILDAFAVSALEVGAANDQVRLAGYSVSFDREFLRENGWRDLFESKFFGFQMHHRILDLSSVIQLFEAADREVPSTWNNNPHRALDDALDALEKAQLMAREIAW
jgi:oligoribonuclease (3'-5' exoribonuclease)